MNVLVSLVLLLMAPTGTTGPPPLSSDLTYRTASWDCSGSSCRQWAAVPRGWTVADGSARRHTFVDRTGTRRLTVRLGNPDRSTRAQAQAASDRIATQDGVHVRALRSFHDEQENYDQTTLVHTVEVGHRTRRVVTRYLALVDLDGSTTTRVITVAGGVDDAAGLGALLATNTRAYTVRG